MDKDRTFVGNKAELILSSAPGYGKSHLIGGLFKALNQKATQIFLTPFQTVSSAGNRSSFISLTNSTIQTPATKPCGRSTNQDSLMRSPKEYFKISSQMLSTGALSQLCRGPAIGPTAPDLPDFDREGFGSAEHLAP